MKKHTDHGKRVTLRSGITVSIEFLYDNLITGVEGGVNYWAEIKDYNTITCDSCRLIMAKAKLREISLDTVCAGNWWEVDAETVKNGIDSLMEPTAKINQAMKNEIAAACVADDAGMLDASHADVIIQFALLKEIVYG
tara:strand:+ start:8197 stop:8610 length:414 start_codon:yes stop_codon:yes gene_type:complete